MAIKTIYIEPHSPEWHSFRNNGVGGSEIGTVLGSQFNEYGSRIKMFYEKIGAVKPNQEPSEVLMHGSYMEDYIESWWRYFDKDIETTMRNKGDDNQVRKCRKVNGYIVNDKYPWLFASPDRMIVKGQPRLIDNPAGDLMFGDPLKDGGVLEFKTINGFVARKYSSTGGIPLYQIVQLQQYLTILELDYGEFAILEDGRHFYVAPMEFNKVISDRIIEESHDFYVNHVVPGRDLYKEYVSEYMKGNKMAAERIQSRINSLEPEVDSSETTREFISSRFNETPESIVGDDSMLVKSIEYKRLSKLIKKLSERKDTVYNSLLNVCVHNNCTKVELPGGGSYKAFKRDGGKNYQLTFSSIKHKTIDEADEIAESL